MIQKIKRECRQLGSTIIWMLLIRFLMAFSRILVLYLPFYFFKDLKISVHVIGLFLSLYGLGMIIGSYTNGKWCDRYNVYYLVQAILLLRLLVSFGLIFLMPIGLILALTFLLGALDGGLRTTFKVQLLAATSEALRLRVNSLNRLVINLGMGVSGVIGGIIANVDFSVFFLYCASFNAIAVVLYLIYQTKTEQNHPSQPQSNNPKEGRLIHDKVFVLLCTIMFLTYFVYLQTAAAYPLYLHQDYGISTHLYGYLFFINAFMILFLELPIITRSRAFNPLAVACLGSVLICCGFAILPFNSSLLWAVLSFALWTLGEILLFSTVTIFIVNRVGEKRRGTYTGAYHSVYGAASIFAPVMGTFLYSYWSGALLWFVCLGIGVCIVPLYYFLEKLNQRSLQV